MAENTIVAGERYEVRGRLGEGGMGAVYRVTDQVRGEEVALKVLGGPASDEAAFLRFKQEFRLMSRLAHPHCCAVYDFGRTPDGSPFFTMEVVPGQELHAAVAAAPDALLGLVAQLLDALGYVHQQGFVHLDLKPENVRVRPDGTLVLMDFGLMAPAGQALEGVRGTLAYVSPEVAKRDRVDARSDLYALGVTLYQMLTGVLPFAAADPLEWVHCHIARQPVTPAARRAVPEPLSAITMRLLAKNAEERYQTAAGLEADLRRCLALYEAHGRIDAFPLGARDVPDRLVIPEKL